MRPEATPASADGYDGARGVNRRFRPPRVPMPATVTLHPDRRLGVVALDGLVSGADFVVAMGGLYEHAAWAPGFAALWDFTAVRELHVDPDDVATIVERTRALGRRMGAGRAAFVVPRALDRMIATLFVHRVRGDARERRLFTTRAEADRWLADDADASAAA